MNDNKELNEKIAVLCGWKAPNHPDCKAVTEGWDTSDKWWIDLEGKLRMCRDIPKYCDDLNAMHEAEKVLVSDQRFAYWHELNNIVMGTVHVTFATAAQRAEAFLKTTTK